MRQLDLGLKGELTITTEMESLSDSLFLDQVPPSWTKRAYDSLNGLTAWYSDLLLRIKELEMWTSDFALPPSVWLSGLKNSTYINITAYMILLKSKVVSYCRFFQPTIFPYGDYAKYGKKKRTSFR
jgi:hypothetical protein